MKPVPRLQIHPIMHNYGACRTIPPTYLGTSSSVGMWRGTDTHRWERQNTDGATNIHFAWLCLMQNVMNYILGSISSNAHIQEELTSALNILL